MRLCAFARLQRVVIKQRKVTQPVGLALELVFGVAVPSSLSRRCPPESPPRAGWILRMCLLCVHVYIWYYTNIWYVYVHAHARRAQTAHNARGADQASGAKPSDGRAQTRKTTTTTTRWCAVRLLASSPLSSSCVECGVAWRASMAGRRRPFQGCLNVDPTHAHNTQNCTLPRVAAVDANSRRAAYYSIL